jgi:hypothetical protein
MTSYNDHTNNNIVGFDDQTLDTLTNGSFEDIITEQLLFAGTGSVVKRDTEEVMSAEITPMVMMINQNKEGVIGLLRGYIDGGDPRYNVEFERPINYYGINTTAREIAEKYRHY